MRLHSLIAVTVFLAGCVIPSGEVRPRGNAHAHNDYEHARPLLDALEYGFGSVEADVHLVEGKLLVGHDPEDLKPGRTLEKLYLEPLKKRVERYGSVYPTGEGIVLLVDIKTDAESTYAALRESFDEYSRMLTSFGPDGTITNAVTVIISGNRPRETLRGEERRLAAFDGRLEDLGKNLPVQFMPLVSDNWQKHFTWRGEGELAESEREKLGALVQQVHEEGRMIRFWGAPDTEKAWRVLHEAGVDLINTDKLAELNEFLGRF